MLVNFRRILRENVGAGDVAKCRIWKSSKSIIVLAATKCRTYYRVGSYCGCGFNRHQLMSLKISVFYRRALATLFFVVIKGCCFIRKYKHTQGVCYIFVFFSVWHIDALKVYTTVFAADITRVTCR